VKTGTSPAPRDRGGKRDEWLTVEEVCAELKISRRTFDRYRALGTGPRCEPLGGHGPLRIRRSWLDSWAEGSDQDIA
jgi:hypothetical protein